MYDPNDRTYEWCIVAVIATGILCVGVALFGFADQGWARAPKKIDCIENMRERLFGELVLTREPKRGAGIYRVMLAPQNQNWQLFDVVLEDTNLPHYLYVFKGYTNSAILIRVYDVDTKPIKNRDAVAHYTDGKTSMFFRDCKIKKGFTRK